MGERSDQITREIEQTKGELGSNLSELENKVKSATDWRTQFQKSPTTMMGIAFGGGVLLSRLVGGNSRRRSHYRSREEWDGGEHEKSPRASGGAGLKKASDTWGNIKGALIGVAANKIHEFIGSSVPGFHEEYKKVENYGSRSSSAARQLGGDGAPHAVYKES
jgi:hypothetical protein